MNINDKIKQILIDKNFSPSYFADEIGVQRSSISHILSGRNRPSFDIIQKIIRRFPELGYEWIMEEDNQSAHTAVYSNRGGLPRSTSERTERLSNGPISGTYANQPLGIRSQRNEVPPLATPIASVDDSHYNESTPSPLTDKKVERILIFYTDGSFREYMPSA